MGQRGTAISYVFIWNLGQIMRENRPLIWDRFTKGGELNDVPENTIWDAYS